ncbi:equilibrative nucleoside transporter 4-like [Sycon ciliatum]|uniref:equilibrative nucleoside transporter 4-like n=1 Tax=Sycon ciliatum TaxID=27933 RepID=UPI0031F6CB9F
MESEEGTRSGVDPQGKHYLLYWAFIFLGAVFVLPYNAFVSAVDYLSFTFPDRNSEAVLPAVNLCVAVLTILGSVVLARISETHFRIRIGFAAFILSLGLVIVIVAVVSGCGSSAAFAGILMADVGVAFAAGVQQASVYGLSSMLPIAYSQAVMTGESVAGSIESTTRIITKAIGNDKLQASTLVYFSVTMAVLLFGILVHLYVKNHRLVHHYYQCGGSSSSSGSDSRDSGDGGVDAVQGHADNSAPANGICGTPYNPYGDGESSSAGELESEGVVKGSAVLSSKHTSFAENGGQVANTADGSNHDNRNAIINSDAIIADDDDSIYDDDDDERALISPSPSGTSHRSGLSTQWVISWQSVKDGVKTRWRITKLIWKWALAIFLNQGMTLLMFPGLFVKVPWHNIGDWTPVILIAVFNYCDLLGKATGPYISPYLTGGRLLAMVGVRSVLVPLVLLCILPCSSPYLDPGSSEIAFVLVTIVGFTAGAFGTLAMSRGPKDISSHRDQELAGMIMVFSCLLGLSTGSVIALGISEGIPCVRTSCKPMSNASSWTANMTTTSMSTTQPSHLLITTVNATMLPTTAGETCSPTCLDSVVP